MYEIWFIDAGKSATSGSPQLWASMLKGNSAICNGAFAFNWKNVDQIRLQTKIFELSMVNKKAEGIKVIIGKDIHSVKIHEERSLLCQHVPNISLKARQILSCIDHLFTSDEVIRQFQQTASGTSDSGGEECVDEPYPPAYVGAEWERITSNLITLREFFRTAVTKHFDNGAGKYFVERLMKFCCWVRDYDKLEKYVHYGTNPSGEEQPGCTEIKYEWAKYMNERSRSHTPASTSTSTPASTPAPSDFDSELHQRYSDNVYWDAIKEMYTIVGEIKSDSNQPADNQHIEQMIGLFRSHQKYMLGFIMTSDYITIRILEKTEQELKMNSYNNIELDDWGLRLLCKLFIAFIYFVDCAISQ